MLLSASAQAIEVCGQRAQGSVVLLHENDIHEVRFNGEKIPVSADGYFMLAFDRDAKLNHSLQILHNDEEENYPTERYSFSISPAQWDIQKINGVPERKVTPKEEDRNEILRENQGLRKALEENNSQSSFWKSGFRMPLEKYRVSGQFGGQRIINTIPKNPHRGMDLAAPEGTPVIAPADGIVVMTGKNFFYSGNMVVVDHGQGLHTIYAHLQDINVKKGQTIKQGEKIATVGKTGRVTGPHLHWGASLHGTRFDPQKLLDISKKNMCSNL